MLNMKSIIGTLVYLKEVKRIKWASAELLYNSQKLAKSYFENHLDMKKFNTTTKLEILKNFGISEAHWDKVLGKSIYIDGRRRMPHILPTQKFKDCNIVLRGAYRKVRHIFVVGHSKSYFYSCLSEHMKIQNKNEPSIKRKKNKKNLYMYSLT